MRPLATRSFSSPLPIAAALIFLLASPETGHAQAPIDTPQTNLAPIAPPSYTPPSSGYGQFDPYAPATSGGMGGFGAGGAAFGGGGRNPGISSGIGPGVTAIGPPTPIGSPIASGAPFSNSAPFANGAQGGGGFFGRLFNGTNAGAPPTLSPNLGAPASGPIWNGQAYGQSSGPYDNPNVYGPQGGPTFGGPPTGSMYPSTAYPSSSPSTLFPGGLFAGGGIFGGFGGSDSDYSAYRLLRGPRFRHTFIGPGNSADDLEINDTDVSVVFAFPNFLYWNQPLYVVPSFSLHLWDGPHSSIGADLPSAAYSGFIDTGWQSDPNQMLGTEFGVRVGAFTDFDNFSTKSIRVMGKGLVHFRLTPTSTLKGGVYYLDRNKVKLLPAGGILWQPNPYTRADIFFPEPKFARYFRTIGTKDVWWYVTGEYGGGSWTIKRASGAKDSIDINDLRVMTGFEWGDTNAIRQGRRTAFAEIGYVFDREVEYRNTPASDFKPDDAFLFRVGIGY